MANRKTSSAKTVALSVQKTYKMYVGGAFPRTESGRYYSPVNGKESLGNLCLASRKDLRNAVVAARSAQGGWAGRTPYNRGQILYRIGEMLEGRRHQFENELKSQGLKLADAQDEVQKTIDRLVVYAGWADKFQQVFSSVNPVATGHFNFSMLEATGVVFVVANEESPLLGLVSLVAPVICGGNSCVVLASQSRPLSAVTFAEVLNSSDLPGGVVNILTGNLGELIEHAALHKDINAIALDRSDADIKALVKELAGSNLKRVICPENEWSDSESGNPYLIEQFCEVKTTWHPIEKIGPSGSGY